MRTLTVIVILLTTLSCSGKNISTDTAFYVDSNGVLLLTGGKKLTVQNIVSVKEYSLEFDYESFDNEGTQIIDSSTYWVYLKSKQKYLSRIQVENGRIVKVVIIQKFAPIIFKTNAKYFLIGEPVNILKNISSIRYKPSEKPGTIIIIEKFENIIPHTMCEILLDGKKQASIDSCIIDEITLFGNSGMIFDAKKSGEK